MSNRLIQLCDITEESSGAVGMKAASLARLLAEGFPVPPGVIVSTIAFRESMAPFDRQIQAILNRTELSSPAEVQIAAGAIQEILSGLALPPELIDALGQALPSLGEGALAVRSSATNEDTSESSFAGKYETSLGVTGLEEIFTAILSCWRSFYSAGALSARRMTRDIGDEQAMAVLIQPLILAECAGVCFTVDPIRLRPDLLLVVSTWGLGAGVVSGSVPTDTTRLRRVDLGVDDFIIADKHTALRPKENGGGVKSVPVPEELRAIPCLPESWLERVGQYGLALEQSFGAPQDMEWAVANGQLWILQSRPITALPPELRAAVQFPVTWENGDEPSHYWWLWAARDSAGTPLLPAELEFKRISTRGSLDAVHFGGSPNTRWIKYFFGRVYMTVARSPYPPGQVRIYEAARRDLYERLAQQDVTLWQYGGPEIIRATRRLAAFDGRGADVPELADHLEDVVAAATRHWMVHTLGPRPIRSPALLEVYARLTGRRAEDAAADIPFLLAGADTIQTRLIEALYDLACLALEDPEAARTLALAHQPTRPPDITDEDALVQNVEPEKPAPTAARRLASGFSRLMDEYGDRLCYRPVPGYPVDLPFPWREVPEHVWEMITNYLPLARQGGPGPRETHADALRAVHVRIEALVAGARDSALVEEFRRKLAYARHNAAGLDEANHYIDQVSEGQYIQARLYAGRWLAERGCLPGPFDVIWINTDEVLAALRDTPAGLDVVIAERRAQYAQWQALIAPACLGLPDSRLPDRPAIPQSPVNLSIRHEDQPAGQLTGEPASRGRATGRARLIINDVPPVDIMPGDVLVAHSAGPLLIPILPAAAALILDTGGPIDHFAITAREFGLPSVCAAGYATGRIPEGARVTVDGFTGRVEWVE